MDAVPADGDDEDDEDDELSSTALHNEVLLLMLLSWRRTEDLVPLLLLPRNTVDGQDLNDSNDDDVEGCTIESTECRVVDG